MAFGLAFASVLFAGRVSVAAAKSDEGTDGSRYVAAGGWSGQVDMESGIPLSAGIPHGDEQFVDPQALQVIPYLSHGILTEADATVVAARSIRDRYPSVGSTRPDGDEIAIRNAIEAQTLAGAEAIRDPYVSPGALSEAQTLASAEAIHDPYVSPGVLGEAVKTNVAEVNFVPGVTDFPTTPQLLASAEAIHDPYVSPGVLGEAVKTNVADVKFVPGVTDFPTTPQPAGDNRVERALEQGPQVIPYLSQGMTSDDVVGARPDDRADRFAHSNVQTPLEVSSSGSTFEWNDALTVGIGALVLALGLGLAFGFLRRPRLAGL